MRLIRVRPELRQLIPEQVRLGQAAHLGPGNREGRVFHGQGREDSLVEELAKGLAGNDLHKVAEDIGADAVPELLTWLVMER